MMLTANANDANDLEGEFKVIRDWDSEDTMLMANTRETAGGKPNPMSNIHARMALSYATDPAQIADLVGKNLEIPTSPFSKESPWADASIADNYAAYDPEKAKAEVQKYKDDTGEDTLKIVVTGPADTNISAQLQALAQQWSEVGIETQIESLEQNAMSLKGVTGDYQVQYAPIYSAPEPDLNYIFWSKSTTRPDGEIGINFTGYATDETQEALERGRNSNDTEARKEAYADLIKLLNEQAVNVHLFFTPYSIVYTDRVHGVQSAAEVPFGNFMPNAIWGQVWLADS
jgi:peptide/nickel transport system substrate-binding protein